MGNPMYLTVNTQLYEGKPGELKHLSTRRKRKKNRFSQQRRAKRKEPKPQSLTVGLRIDHNAEYLSRRELESSITEGNNPVGEKRKTADLIQSTTRHVKPCGKQEVGSQPCRSVSQGVGLASCLPKTAWPPTQIITLNILAEENWKVPSQKVIILQVKREKQPI